MKRIAVSVGVLALVSAALAGEITVTGTGTVKRQPDKMKIMFSVSSIDPDMTGARQAFAEKTAMVAAALAAAGVSSNEVTTAGIYMNKSNMWGQAPTEPVGAMEDKLRKAIGWNRLRRGFGLR